MSRLSQGLAILVMGVLLGMVVHKGHADVSMLAKQHSGQQFWVELGRYFIGNLAGGTAPRDSKGR